MPHSSSLDLIQQVHRSCQQQFGWLSQLLCDTSTPTASAFSSAHANGLGEDHRPQFWAT